MQGFFPMQISGPFQINFHVDVKLMPETLRIFGDACREGVVQNTNQKYQTKMYEKIIL